MGGGTTPVTKPLPPLRLVDGKLVFSGFPIPKVYLPVERPLKIKIESTKLDGSVVTEDWEGLNARVLMHENDHLNGVLLIDRVEDKYLKPAEPRLREIKKRYNP